MSSHSTAPHTLFRPRTKLRIISVAAIIAVSLTASPAHATGSTLDNTFGTNGTTTTIISHTGNDGDASSMAVQADGKILVAGYAEMTLDYNNPRFALVRYNHDGTLDTSFDGDTGTGNGIVTTIIGEYAYGTSVVIQPDGKILVAGSTYCDGCFTGDFALVRYNTNGTLDTDFGNGGKAITDLGGNDQGNSVAIQADRKILVAGFSGNDFALVRYNTNGTLDTDFGNGGKAITTITNLGENAQEGRGRSVAIQPDGNILVAGEARVGGNFDFVVVSYTTTGALNTSFGTAGTGVVITNLGGADSGRSVAIQPDGKIVVAGTGQINGSKDFALVRYNTNGTLDTSFDGDTGTGSGIVTKDLGGEQQGYSVAVQQDGKLLVAGVTNNVLALLRFNSNGKLDTSFDNDGIVTTAFLSGSSGRAVATQPNGQILVAGISYQTPFVFVMARYNASLLAVTLAATSPSSSSAPISFTVTGNSDIDCSTLSTVAGVDFDLTGITAITEIEQTSPTVCTINATSSAAADGVPVTSTLTAASSFSVGFTNANTRTTMDVPSQSITVTLPRAPTTATTPPPPVPAVALITTPAITTPTTTTVPATTTTTPTAEPAMLMPTVAVINALPVTNDLISTRFLGRGNRLLVRFSGFVPFEFVRLIVASTPQVVGSGYADAQGDVELTGTLPIDLEPGDHRLIVFAPTSGRGASQSISVEAPQLPATGVNSPLVLGITLLAIGTAIYAIRRRTRRDLDPQSQW